MQTLINYVLDQNPLMVTLFALSVVCLAATLDRLVFWMSSALKHRPIPPEVYDRDSPEREAVLAQLRSKRPGHYTREVLLTCLQPSVGKDQIAQTVSEQMDIMSSGVGLLELIAKVAPLVGILGTVVGMLVSFGGVGAMATTSPAAISNGISLALWTTAYGLIISIVATVASAAFRKCVHHATLRMGRIVCGIQDINNTHNV